MATSRSETDLKWPSGAVSKINNLDLRTFGTWSTGSEKMGRWRTISGPSRGRWSSGRAQKHRGFWPFLGVQKPRRTLPERKLVEGIGFEPVAFRIGNFATTSLLL